MTIQDDLLTWHYGLMAELWAEFSTETPELEFFQQAIARYGQPVLDVACGAGRLLLPLLQAGVEIEGCDLSADMLEQCRKKAAGQGFSPRLYQQPMHALDLPRKYRTIYICGSFGLAGSRANDLETLRRCHAALEDGGALLLNIDAEYTSARVWGHWLREFRQTLPQPWPEEATAQTAADGSLYLTRFRTTHIDPVEQSYTRQVRLEKWIAGERAAAEEYTLRGNNYLKPEVELMLKTAGFSDIVVQGAYTHQPAAADNEELVFTAIK